MNYQVLCRDPIADSIAEPRSRNFIVIEKLSYRCVEGGPYNLYLLVKRGVDTLTALHLIEKKLGLPRGSARAAGLKDADATTVQHVAIASTNTPKTVTLRLKNGGFIALRWICRLRYPVQPPSIRGNRFTVVLKLYPEAAKSVEHVLNQLADKLIPAYYGYQRFGTIRPVTHLLGYARALGSYPTYLRTLLDQAFPEEAVDAITWRILRRGNVRIYEAEAWRRLRKSLSAAIDYMEKLLRGLDLEGLQALVFNLYLSARIREGYPLDKPIEGERVGREGLPIAIVPGRGFTPGKESKKLYEEVLAGIGLRLETLTRLPVKGYWRPVALRVEQLSWSLVGDNLLVLRFTLPRAMYATTVLREIASRPY
jgi:tRNA pseudouridine13 synthase